MFYENKKEYFLLYYERNPIQYPLHVHQYIELVHVVEGLLDMYIGSKKYRLYPGDVALIFPNIAHDYHVLSGQDDTQLHILNCYPNYLPFHETILLNMIPQTPVLHANDVHPDILYAEKRLFEIKQDSFDQALIGSLLSLMLSRLLPNLSLSSTEDQPSRSLSGEIINYIGKHFREDLSLTSIAKHLGIGRCALSRIFSNVLQVSFSTYINSLRIDFAEYLLLSTDLGMMDIAIECGYHNQQTFYRLFKSFHGCTPKEYRERTRNHSAVTPLQKVIYEPQYGQENEV